MPEVRPEITKHNEAEIDRRIEQSFRSHREAPNGRNAFAWVMRYLENNRYRNKFDDTFRGAPSSKEWWEDQFCQICDKRRTACVCAVGREE